MCNKLYDVVSIKYEDEEFKELSVKLTRWCLNNVLSFIVIMTHSCYGLHTRFSVYNLIVYFISDNMKHYGGNTHIQRTFQT
jgi:hypothetical protein